MHTHVKFTSCKKCKDVPLVRGRAKNKKLNLTLAKKVRWCLFMNTIVLYAKVQAL